MKLKRIIIKNFRSLVDIDIPIDDNTVLIGENNSGKTALLEALKIILPWNQRGRSNPFKEYDYHMTKEIDSPQTCEGILIELWFKEDSTGEWPDSLVQDLNDIIQTDPFKDLNLIGLRVHSNYNDDLEEDFAWEFLNLMGEPLTLTLSNKNLSKFLSYIRVFYLSPLRDSKTEFSPRSKYWGRIIKNLKIKEDEKEELIKNLADINKILLNGDERLEEVINVLDSSKEIMELGSGQRTSIRALPLKPWELMSKSELVVKSRGNDVEFPLALHGQGTQSLAVIFLFQAFINVLLKPTFKEDTKAIIALEEPEAHLHPQAIRSLASNLMQMESQKIISSHSPYFIQEIPFEQIRMFKRVDALSKVLYIKRKFTLKIPENYKLTSFCDGDKYFYDSDTSTLHLKGKMNGEEYRKFIRIFRNEPEVVRDIKGLRDESQLYIDDKELSKLDTYAKRIRGEILFARAWILCEGQSDYLMIKFFAELLEEPLDALGISVIDYQNNGSPEAFVSLAINFEIPWILFCDGDGAGDVTVNKLNEFPLTDLEKNSIRQLPRGMDLEEFLVKNGFLKDYLQIFNEEHISLEKNEGDAGFEEEIINILHDNKTECAIALIKKLKDSNADKSRVPPFFKSLIEYIRDDIK